MDLRVMIKEMIKQGYSDADIVANLKELGIDNVEEAIAGALAAEEKSAPKAMLKTQTQHRTEEPAAEIETTQETASESQTQSQADEEEIEGLSNSKSLFEEDAPPKDVDDALGGEKPLFESNPKPQGHVIMPKDDAQEIVSRPAGKAQAQNEVEPHGEEEVKSLFGDLRKDAPAAQGGKTMQAMPAEDEIPKLEITSIYGGEEKSTDIASMLNKAGIETPMRAMPQASIADADAIERKLDDLESAIKALTEVNRQILEANRETLFRLKTQK